MELKPVYDEHFDTYYGQAVVVQENDRKILKSYGRKSATIDGIKAKVHFCKTNGQERHIREFLRQNHFNMVGLKNREQLLARYGDRS